MEDSTLPNVSIEISTPDMKSLKREIYTDNERSTHCGIIEGSRLTDMLDVADCIIDKMEYYSLFTSNCQHFCNNFLNHYGFKVYGTTLGKEVTAEIEKQIDKTPEQNAVLEKLQQMHANGDISDAPLPLMPVNKDASLQLVPFRSAPLQPSQSEIEARMRRHFAALLNALVGAN